MHVRERSTKFAAYRIAGENFREFRELQAIRKILSGNVLFLLTKIEQYRWFAKIFSRENFPLYGKSKPFHEDFWSCAVH